MIPRPTTASEVIDALGGTFAVARLVGKTPQAVSSWRKVGLPARTYLVLSTEMQKRGIPVDPALWGLEPAQ